MKGGLAIPLTGRKMDERPAQTLDVFWLPFNFIPGDRLGTSFFHIVSSSVKEMTEQPLRKCSFLLLFFFVLKNNNFKGVLRNYKKRRRSYV
jgi:hypothetical protein